MAVTTPRLLGFLTSLKDPNKISSIGYFKYAVTRNYLHVLVKKCRVRYIFGPIFSL